VGRGIRNCNPKKLRPPFPSSRGKGTEREVSGKTKESKRVSYGGEIKKKE